MPKLALSRKKHLPVLSFFDGTYLPHQALKIIWELRHFKIVEEDAERLLVKYDDMTLRMRRCCAVNLREWGVWRRCYLPNFSLNGKTVLDAGAGSGETAFLFFLHGAKKVIAIEPDVKAIQCLADNAFANGWNIQIINEAFHLKHLDIPHDYMKMDCEGCEGLLLSIDYEKPCVIEVHDRDTFEKFSARNFKRIHSFSKDISIISNCNES